MPKTRKDRRAKQCNNYLKGKARSPYDHTRTLKRSLEESGKDFDGETNSAVCPQCHPVLSRHAKVFKEMIHRGKNVILYQSVQKVK